MMWRSRQRPLLLIAAGIVLIFGAFMMGRVSGDGRTDADRQAGDAARDEPTIWTCSMHPQIQLPEPGKCPICFMDLIPVQSGDDADLGPRQLVLSESARAMAGIQTTAAIRAFAEKSVRMYGKLAYDEAKVVFITAWVPGRLDRLYADFTGTTVQKGDHLAELYSPELVAAQEELIQAHRAVRALGNTGSEALRTTAQATVDATREKLRLYGLTAEQIRDVEQSGKTSDHLTIYAPAGGVVVHKQAREGMYVSTGTPIYTIADLRKLWVFFEAYESDIPWLHYGQHLEFTVESFPGERFKAVISFIDPLVDPKTRTVKVRAVVDNAAGRLKPDMFATGVLKSRLDADGHVIDVSLANKWICPMHPEVIRDRAGICDVCQMDLVSSAKLGFVSGGEHAGEAPVLIPVSAPLVTGRRAVVYVQVTTDGAAVFEGREVELGPRAGQFYVVRSGISEGDLVVTNGAFKLDSELQLQARPSMMSPKGGRAPTAHDHASAPQGSVAPRDLGTPSPPAMIPMAVRVALTPVYDAYFGVQTALANDDAAAARTASRDLGTAAAAAQSAAAAGEVPNIAKFSGAIRSGAVAMTDAATIADIRAAFFTVSNAAIEIQKLAGHTGEATHYIAHCPMARDGDGASWLQTTNAIWNPYWGSEMLHCGSIDDEFAASAGAETHEH